MELLSFNLPVALRRRLAAEARRRGVSQASVIRASLESALLGRPRGPRRRSRLAAECAKLDPKFEKAMAEEGLSRELDTWPEY